MPTAIEFSFSLPYKITRRRHWVVACCPALDLCSQGDNEEEAKKNLTEATRVFLVSCYERGTLTQVLKDCGFSPVELRTGRRVSSKRQIRVSIPLQTPSDVQCHA